MVWTGSVPNRDGSSVEDDHMMGGEPLCEVVVRPRMRTWAPGGVPQTATRRLGGDAEEGSHDGNVIFSLVLM